MDAMPIATRERLEDEYMSMADRVEKMRAFISRHSETMNSDPDFGLLVAQANAMASYLTILHLRLQADYEKRKSREVDNGTETKGEGDAEQA